MSTFDERETAFEAKFAHDAEARFKAEARVNRALGLWAAGLLGKTGAEAEAFALATVKADFAEAGHEDVVRMVAGALAGRADAQAVRERRADLLAAELARAESGA